MKNFYFLVIVFFFFFGQLFAQDFSKIFYRPADCHGSGAIVNQETDEVLVRVDEPQYIFIHRIKMEASFHKQGEKVYLVAKNGKMYPITQLRIRWQRLANVDNRYLKGEEFSRMHYGPGWLIDRPLKLFF